VLIVQTAWHSHLRWSWVADGARAHLDRWRLVNLTLLAAGALGGALATQVAWLPSAARVACGVVGAAFLALAGVVQQWLLGREWVMRWTTARAASEAIKAETFRYLAGVEPYADAHRDAELIRHLREIHERSADFALDFDRATPDGTPLPDVHDLSGYVTMRAREQQLWHHGRVADHHAKARRLRRMELATTLAAAVLAAVAGALRLPDLSAWVGVTTTFGAAIAAHLGAGQHDRIAASYARTVVQLRLLISGIDPETATPEQGALFVRDVEGVLAAQNGTWVSLLGS
jgi:SMODS and SLOG-associating 2TM effector domain 1/Protein of unknown function (DUF4231)